MLTGNLVRVRYSKSKVIPMYLDPTNPDLLETAENLLLIFRDGVGRTRGELEEEIQTLLGEGPPLSNIAQQGLAKVLEDRAEFEVVSEAHPEELRRVVFTLAAEERRSLRSAGYRAPFRRDKVLNEAAQRLNLTPDQVAAGLFADLKDENRMLGFDDLSPERLIQRYNVALAQAVLLKATLVTVRLRREPPDRLRRLFRRLKFHRLLHRIEGSPTQGYVIQIDGPMSLFTSTTKYGLQLALVLPAILQCREFELEAELRWGPKREPRSFSLSHRDGLVSHYRDADSYIPAEVRGFEERFRQIAPHWELAESSDLFELGGEGVWVPDYRFTHRHDGQTVFVEVVGFWKSAALERLLRTLPRHGPPLWLLSVTEKLKVDEANGPDWWSHPRLLKFREVPNASELRDRLDTLIGSHPSATAAPSPLNDALPTSPASPKRPTRKRHTASAPTPDLLAPDKGE
ncbi:protein of unknown function DUF790 [Isosphaera pallida ATCC 43644]|uniref:DUF790 family protein n=1 Tax=Isosphaera pallida (strain ATCC 43644 / DSM 9630 / IS1B) TaxID=575540 RepID=E8QWR8_ISOPI|nr:DUF790 family protein [Isosphaera pallida]ADV62968.1 protein of unknown function DUF790 [Isosphaera pallida ATCC 43644]